MDDVIRIAAMLAALGTAEPQTRATTPQLAPPAAATMRQPVPSVRAPMRDLAPRPVAERAAWPGEDRFRHVAMSWAVTSFAFAAARSSQQDTGTALAIALPVSAASGLAKELADRRRGGAFSAGDLLADAAGIGLAWLVLREVH